MKKPLQIMVWCGLTEKGATLPYFVKTGDKIDQVYYRRKILRHAKKEGFRLFNTKNWVFFKNT